MHHIAAVLTKMVRMAGTAPTVTVTESEAETEAQAMEFEEVDEFREDTLYDATNLRDFVSRRVEPEDVIEIKRFLQKEDYAFFKFEDPYLLFEKCSFSLVISDVIEVDRIIAAAFFDDRPIDPAITAFRKKSPEFKNIFHLNTLYMRLFATSPEVQSDIALTEIVAYTFAHCSSIEYIIVECPNIETAGVFHFNPNVKQIEVNPTGKLNKLVFVYAKDDLLPSLKIREGRESDLDDLAPLLPMDLATMKEEFGKVALTDVIGISDKRNQSVVAEWDQEAVGIMLVTTDMNYEMLNGFYHLEPFHGLHKPYHKDEVKVHCYNTRNVVEIPIDGWMEEAKEAMEMRGSRQHDDEDLAYTVESQRDDFLAEYETDSSIKTSEERGCHLFEPKVSEDIINYGLRDRTPTDSLVDAQLMNERMDNIKAIADKLRGLQSQDEELGEMDYYEGMGEYDEDEGDEARGSRPSDPSHGKGPRGTRKTELSKVNLLTFLDEFMGEDDMQNEEKDEDIQFLHDVKQMSSDDDVDPDHSSESSTPTPNTVGTDSLSGSGSGSRSGSSETEIEAASMHDVAEETEMPGPDPGPDLQAETQEMAGEMDDSEVDGKTGSRSPSETETDQTEADTIFDDETMTSLSTSHIPEEKVYEEEFWGEDQEETKERKGEEEELTSEQERERRRQLRKTRRMSRMTKKYGIYPGEDGLDREEEMGGEEYLGEELGEAELELTPSELFEAGMRAIRAKAKRKSLLDRMQAAQDAFGIDFEHRGKDFYRRWSEDTLFLGRPGWDSQFEDKIELMRKVWDIYLSLKNEGMTWEAAKYYLTLEELVAIEEANILTRGNLLKLLTLLLPDETVFPFRRYINPKVPKYYGLPNAIAIKIFNIDKKFHMRAKELLKGVFKYFPNREYLAVTIPQGHKEPSWLEHFVRVVPRIDCSYPYELFVAHKAYFNTTLKVRRARHEDIPKVRDLLDSLQEKLTIFDDFKHAVCCKHYNAFVVEVKSPTAPIVGIAVVSDETESQTYHVNYKLDHHFYYNMHDERDQAYIHHLILFPIFQAFGRQFIKEILRIAQKTCIYQRIYPNFVRNERTLHQTILNNMDEWFAVTPKRRIHYEYLNLLGDPYDLERLPPAYVTRHQDPFAVVCFGKKFSFEQKVNLNSRIVFIGASETTLSCIAKLICSSFRGYKRLTVIDKYGMPGQLEPSPARNALFSLRKGGSALSFRTDAEWVQSLGIQHWANIVVGKVTKIVRSEKHVVVNKDQIVPYDILIVATGRQFQRPDCEEPEVDDPNFLSFKRKIRQRLSMPCDCHHDLTFKKPKPKNLFLINTEVEGEIFLKFVKDYMPFMKRKKIIIFGNGFKMFSTVQGLLLFGFPGERIVMITTPHFEVEWERLVGYNVSETVRLPMKHEMRKLGVHVVDNYDFSHWESCPISGLIKRTHFTSPSESDHKISISTYAFVSFRYRRVDDSIVSALAEAYILYQDGIVIDENFRTNDPCIYAAGPCATYKKTLLAQNEDHWYFQSEEVGQKLADILIERVGSEGGVTADVQSKDVYKFRKPWIRSTVLPGGWHFMLLRSGGAPMHTRCPHSNNLCDEECQCITEIVTGSTNKDEDPTQRYFKIRLNGQFRIVGVECMSKKSFSPSNFMGLHGQHEVILNKLMERLEKGETKDLYDHFSQPWFGAFCSDEWGSFMQELQEVYKDHDLGDGTRMGDFIRDYVANLDNPETIQIDPNIIRSVWDNSGLKDNIELRFLTFLKYHKFSLPMYARNDMVEDLLDERSTSNLYFPKTMNY